MTKTRDELDDLLYSLAQETFFRSELDESDELRRRADVLRAALYPEFCVDVAPTARKHLKGRAVSEAGAFASPSQTAEGDAILRQIELGVGSREWRQRLEADLCSGIEAIEQGAALGLAGGIVQVLIFCPLIKARLRHVPKLAPDEWTPEARRAAVQRLAVALAKKLVTVASGENGIRAFDDPDERRLLAVDALEALGATDAHNIIRKPRLKT